MTRHVTGAGGDVVALRPPEGSATVVVSGVTIRYETRGAGAPLVLLADAEGRAGADGLLEALEGHFRIVAPDLGAEEPEEQFAGLLRRFLEGLGWDRITVLATPVAAGLAHLLDPEGIAGVVVLGREGAPEDLPAPVLVIDPRSEDAAAEVVRWLSPPADPRR